MIIKPITTNFINSWRGKAAIVCFISLIISTTAFSQWAVPMGQRDHNSIESLISDSLLFFGLVFLSSGIHATILDFLEEEGANVKLKRKL